MLIRHQKNTAYELTFPMIDSTTPASFKSGVSPVDTAYYNDGAGWLALAITDTASEIASTGLYEISLTAAELNHDQVVIKFSVSGAADTGYLLDMQGIPSLSTNAKFEVNGELIDVLRTDTTAELGGVPVASPDLHTMVQWLYMQARNEMITTSTLATVKNDAGTAIATSTLSDDGTTFTRGEYS